MNKFLKIITLKKLFFIISFVFLLLQNFNCHAGSSEKGGGDSGKSSTTGKSSGKKNALEDSCDSSSSGKTTKSKECDASISSDSISSSVFSWGGTPYLENNSSISNSLAGNSFDVSFLPGTTISVTNSIGINLNLTSSFTSEGAALITSTPQGLANSTSLVNLNNIESISLSIGLELVALDGNSKNMNLSPLDNKVTVQTVSSANKIFNNLDNVGGSNGLILTVSPIVVANLQSSISKSGIVSLVIQSQELLNSEPTPASNNLNNALNILINSENISPEIIQTALPTALNDALDAISEIKPIINIDDNSDIANVARALNSIKINSIPGLQNK